MAQRGEEVPASSAPPGRPGSPLLAVVAAAVLVVAVAGIVVGLRVANRGVEPEGQNWWMVAEILMALGYLPAGVLLAARPGRRLLGALLMVVGGAALVDALATQYLGYATSRGRAPAWPGFASSSTWAWVLGGAVAATGLLLAIASSTGPDRRLRIMLGVAAFGVVALVLPQVTASWPATLGENPLEVESGTAGRALNLTGDAGQVVVDLVATLAVVLLAVRWWSRRRTGDDLLPAWLLAGGIVVWLAVVPPALAGIGGRFPAPDVLVPILLIATVPLLVVGALIGVIRVAPSGLERASHRFLEWLLLAAGIVLIYTGLVAGLGHLVGGSGPTWLLVAATGVIAMLIEPGRRRVRAVVDQLVYGSRDDPLSLVRQVVDHVSTADQDEELLPALAANLGREMRLDAVAIDVAGPTGWERAATYGTGLGPGGPDPPAGTTREILLRHHEQVVGRLVVAWADAPSLRPRDEATLIELAAPVALAVSWVRLAADLRRSGVAVLSAREEERRRLRRDLHDGLGPSLTGISLGLRTAIRQLERHDVDPATYGLLTRLADEVDGTVEDVKRIVRDLRPSALDELGLIGAVAEFARRFDGAVQIHLELPRQEPSLPAAVEVAAYRIVTEALTNVVRHASADRCWLRIEACDTVEIDVVDDGVGLGAEAPPGLGLAGMRERAVELGGQVTVAPHVPHGTHLHARLPAVLP